MFEFNQIVSQMSSQPKSYKEVKEMEEPDEGKGREVTALDGTRLISVLELPSRYQKVFVDRFPHFNCVQSLVFNDVFKTDKSIGN